MRGLTNAAKRVLHAVTDDGQHPEDAYMLAALLLVIFAGLQGWLD